MLIFLVVLLASLALSFAIITFSLNILKQTPLNYGNNNVPNILQKPPYIYLITGILFLIFFKLMFRVLTFILLGG
ncbi:MAG TPA: hypothetical protein DEF34_12875 [Desulfotomaculum sp.]|nr:MAG: hypothetical protein VR67_01890 [Peptococcaceae bacterium BRH_c8a]KJS75818.1 MAG: hypothetical protein JL56_06780 [Desulfotomaculum sp. BICA1-6]HBX24504.1 hypothetical protein [Desulfotomaculum sp.]